MPATRSGLRLLAVSASAAALLITLLPGATTASGGIVFDGSPGINPPPSTLGPYAMTPFGPDGLVPHSTTTSVPAPGGGSVGFGGASLFVVSPSGVAGGWTAGYAGHVYALGPDVITLTLPSGTRAFYFYAEPNRPGGPYTVTATSSNGTTSGPVTFTGLGFGVRAQYFGFYMSTTASATLASITISNDASHDTIVGEFGIYRETPTAAPMVLDFSPGAGRVGSNVTIMGTNLTYTTRVTFNGVAASFSVRDPHTIVARVPVGATTGPIRVSSPYGSGQHPRSFVVLP
jgi:hypothetical protein